MRSPCAVGVRALAGLRRTQLIQGTVASRRMWQVGGLGACEPRSLHRAWRAAQVDALEGPCQWESPCTSSISSSQWESPCPSSISSSGVRVCRLCTVLTRSTCREVPAWHQA